MKKVLIVAVCIILFLANVPIAFAEDGYSDNILFGLPAHRGKSLTNITTSNLMELTDGNIETGVNVTHSLGNSPMVFVELPEVQYISLIRYNAGYNNSVALYDVNQNVVFTKSNPSKTGWIVVEVPDVPAKYIALRNGYGSGVVFRELEAYTRPMPDIAVSQIVATPISMTEIKVTWQEPEDLANYAGVEIQLGDDIVTVPKGTTQYIFSDLEPQTRYDFMIRSFTPTGRKTENQSFFAYTLGPEDLQPSEITNLKSYVFNDRIKFTWDNPNNIKEVQIYRDGVQIATAHIPANTFTDYDLDEHTTYTFVFITANEYGKSKGISVTETTKGKPRGKIPYVIANPGDGSAYVSYPKHRDADSYNIYVDGHLYTNTTKTSVKVTGLENDQTYTIQVSVLNDYGESDLSDPVEVTPQEGLGPIFDGEPNWGFTVADIIINAVVIIGALSSFVLLALAIAYGPRLIELIKNAASGE